MSYTDVFGGTIIYPSDVSYLALALDADTALDWPLESSAASTVVARIIDITPASAGLSIIMPDATTSGVGQTVLFNNLGPDTVTIKSSTGTTLLSLAAGEQWQLYLIDSSTPTGLWRNFRYGAATAQAQASSLAGSGLVAIGATLAQAYTVAEYNSNRTLATTDRAQTILWSGGLGAFTLPVAATVGNNWFVNLRNGGSGSLTLAPSGGALINTGVSLALAPGDSAVLCCDGTNFYTIGLGQSAVFAFDYTSINLAGLSGNYTLTGSELNRIAYTFTGALSGNIVVIAPNTVQQYWVNNATSGASYTLDIKTAAQVTPLNVPRNQRGIYYSDGTNIVKADTTSGVATPIAVADGGTGATNITTARANLGASAVGDAVFTAASAAAGRAALAVSVVGDAVFVAADAAAARTAIGAQASLGYTPVNKAGDTMTGNLTSRVSGGGENLLFDPPTTGSFVAFAINGVPGGYVGRGSLVTGGGTNDLGLRGQSAIYMSGSGGVADAILTGAGFTMPGARGLGFGGRAPEAGLSVNQTCADNNAANNAGIALYSNNSSIQCTYGWNNISCNASFNIRVSGGVAAAFDTSGGLTVTGQCKATDFFTTLTAAGYGILGGTRIEVYGSGSGFGKIDQYVNTTLVSTIDGAGNLTATGNITANSDRRLKTDIEPLTGSLAAILAMQGVRYTRISDGSRQIGLIAQDVEAVRPEYVLTAADDEGTKSLAYANIVADLIEAVKTLSARNDALNGRLAALEAGQ